MKIKQVCALTGLTARTVRFYCERGLIHPTSYEQNDRNYYEYSQDDVRILRRVGTLRRAEFSLEEIGCMMQDEEKVGAIIASHMQKLRDREARTEQLLYKMQSLCDQPNVNFAAFADALEDDALPEKD